MNAWSLEFSFRVDTDNAIIYAKIHGLWKADTARSYHEDFKAEVQPLLGKPWAKLIDLSNWRTSYPDVIAIIGKHMIWSTENGCALSVYVLNNPSTFNQLNQMFSKGRIKEVALTFRTMAEAERHLKEHWIGKLGNTPPQPRDIC
jgi:hypothetical protein